MLNSLSAARTGSRRPATDSNCLTRGRFIGSALFNPLFMSWFAASRLRTGLTIRSTDSATPRADSHCSDSRSRACAARASSRQGLCVLARTI